jgi:hypothetical protein
MNENSNGGNASQQADPTLQDEHDPRLMYLNYLTDAHTLADAYLFPVANPASLQKAVEDGVKKIKDGLVDPVDGSPTNINWTAHSYMVFVLDSGSGQKLTTVDFWHLDGNNKINTTFKHGKRLKAFDNCTVLSYINIRKNKKGDPIGHPVPEKELYNWEAHHTKAGGKDRKPKSHENSGTNVGP